MPRQGLITSRPFGVFPVRRYGVELYYSFLTGPRPACSQCGIESSHNRPSKTVALFPAELPITEK